MFDSKKRAFIFLIISICCALGATFLFGNYVKQTEEALGKFEKILIAKSDIPAGSPIEEDQLETMEIPKKYVGDSFIKNQKELKGNISLVPISEGQVITKAMLRRVTNLENSEMRVVQLRTPLAVFDDQIDVRDKVDLIGSYEKETNNDKEEKRITELVLSNVEVVRVYKKGAEIVSIGVALNQENARRVVWMLNYGKELRVVKSNVLAQVGSGN